MGLSTIVADVDTPAIATINLGRDLSYLPHPTTILGATLRDVPLVTNTGVPLPSKRSSRHLKIKSLILMDEEEIK